MKTIVKLIIAAAVIHACFRGSQAAWGYYQFKDAAQQTIIFGYGSTVGQLEEQILRRAADFDVPIQPENLEVTRDGARTIAEASYTKSVELLPSYKYPFKFDFKVDALAMNPTVAEEVIQSK